MSSDGVVRLSISPSQGDDPGFKSRSEQFVELSSPVSLFILQGIIPYNRGTIVIIIIPQIILQRITYIKNIAISIFLIFLFLHLLITFFYY